MLFNTNHDCGCIITIAHFESKSDEMSVRKAPDLGHFGVCISFTSFSLISLTVYVEPRFGLLTKCDGIGERFTYYSSNNVAKEILKLGFISIICFLRHLFYTNYQNIE